MFEIKTFHSFKTVFWTLNRLDPEPFGPHWSPLYGEKSWNIFIQKKKVENFFSTEERM